MLPRDRVHSAADSLIKGTFKRECAKALLNFFHSYQTYNKKFVPNKFLALGRPTFVQLVYNISFRTSQKHSASSL